MTTTERLLDGIRNLGFAIRYESMEHAYGEVSFEERTVTLRPDLKPDVLLATCAHEIAHIALYQSDRDYNDEYETESTASAFLARCIIGLEAGGTIGEVTV